MALSKSLEFNGTGVFVDYHKISNIVVYYNESKVEVSFESYKDSVARGEGKVSVGNLCSLSMQVNLSEPLIPQIYEKAQNCEDCVLYQSVDC